MLGKPLRTSAIVTLTGLVFTAGGAVAQTPTPPASSSESDGGAVFPPTLVELATAEYPAEARAMHPEPGVVFRVTLDAGGNVTATFGTLWSTVEAHNFLDARVYDNYGQERPGRSFQIKLTGKL